MFEEAADDALHPDILRHAGHPRPQAADAAHHQVDLHAGLGGAVQVLDDLGIDQRVHLGPDRPGTAGLHMGDLVLDELPERSEEHKSELQSLMRNSYAVFCLKKKKQSAMS